MRYKVRKLNLGTSDQLDKLAHASGEVYSETVVRFWRVVRKKDIWLKEKSLKRWIPNSPNRDLHAHTADACVESFFDALSSWRELRKTDPKARPPHKRKWYYKIVYKGSAIRLKDGQLRLSNGRGNDPLYIPWKWEKPKQLEIGWTGTQYQARATYAIEEEPKQPLGNSVAGIDLGEIHMAVAHTGEECIILNGRGLRSKKQYRNKLKAKLNKLIDRKKKGSRRRKKLIRSKRKQLAKVNNQIRDIEHKQTSRLIAALYERGIATLVIGDVRNIRKNLDYGKSANQHLHEWGSGITRRMLTYKAEDHGMEVVLQNEAYTSQECPVDETRNKVNGRVYRCKTCGFEYHRDGVGAWNIRKKYLVQEGLEPVVGDMAPPIGLRWKPHLRCSSSSGSKTQQ